MSQQPLFVPASDGWYARPGDPPGVMRHWDGKTWQCEFRGPIKDHFNHLRSLDPATRSDADRDLLKQLTRDVSDIEDLVLGDPSANPPLVQIAAPAPYIPPPTATYGTGLSATPSSYAPPPQAAPVFRGPQPPQPIAQPMAQPMAQAPMAPAPMAPAPLAQPPVAQPMVQPPVVQPMAQPAAMAQAPMAQPPVAPSPMTYMGPPPTQPYAAPQPAAQPGLKPYAPQQSAPPATQPYVPVQPAQPTNQPYQPQPAQTPQQPPQAQMPQQYAPTFGQPVPPIPSGGPVPPVRTKKRPNWLRRGLVIVLTLIVGTAVRFGFSAVADSTIFSSTTSANLAVSSCVTLSYPVGATDSKSVKWAKSDCTTPTNGPVSYVIVSKLTGAAQCDPDSQYVQTFSSGSKVSYTFCLMENVTVGQCLYEDDKGFLFDVPCTDTRALVKVAQRVDQGSGVECAAGEGAWRFPAGNRTYCLSKP